MLGFAVTVLLVLIALTHLYPIVGRDGSDQPEIR